MKQKKARVKLWGVLTPVFAVLLAASIVGNSVANYYSTTLNVALDVETYRIVKGGFQREHRLLHQRFCER